MPAVSALAVAPVKGMRLVEAGEVALGSSGAAGDRRFVVRLPDGRIASTSRHPRLVQVVPRLDAAAGRLALAFPGGEVVEAAVELGAPAATAFYDGREVPGRVVEGPFAAALGAHLGTPVQLVALDAGARGGDDHAVTLMSEATVAAVGAALGTDGPPDPRRFRMTLTVDGVEAWAEHGWAGRRLEAGDVVLEVVAPVPRCVVTTRDPDAGRRDLPVLKALAALRGRRDVTLGVWLEVVRPGVVRRGDPVSVL